ncbi:MAG: ribbon-helix-helix domain-containing protein [Anaerolineae bacterium]
MIRTQIQLEERQYHVLKELSAHYQVPVAELVREAVDLLLKTKREVVVPADERRRRALAAVGRYHSELSDLAENHDLYLAQAYEDAAP